MSMFNNRSDCGRTINRYYEDLSFFYLKCIELVKGLHRWIFWNVFEERVWCLIKRFC